MLQTKIDFSANKSTSANSINAISSDKLIVETNGKDRRTEYITLGAKLSFIKLKQAFITAPILHHFDPKCHVRIETDMSDYAIDGI